MPFSKLKGGYSKPAMADVGVFVVSVWLIK